MVFESIIDIPFSGIRFLAISRLPLVLLSVSTADQELRTTICEYTPQHTGLPPKISKAEVQS